jgi:hypothetical protein
MKTGILKSFLVICLALIYFINISGYNVIYTINRFIIQREMGELISHGAFLKDLSILRIYKPQEHPEFSRDRNEFTFKGELYDIVREDHSGPVTIFLCINDTKEQQLIGNMNRMQSNKHLVTLMNHFMTIALPTPQFKILQYSFKEFDYPYITLSLNSAYIPQFSPPPERS